MYSCHETAPLTCVDKYTTALSKSLCTAKHSFRYFDEGILPSHNTLCEIDETPFGQSDVDRRFRTPEEQAILDATADIYD